MPHRNSSVLIINSGTCEFFPIVIWYDIKRNSIYMVFRCALKEKILQTLQKFISKNQSNKLINKLKWI